jgi:hypothetical protein
VEKKDERLKWAKKVLEERKKGLKVLTLTYSNSSLAERVVKKYPHPTFSRSASFISAQPSDRPYQDRHVLEHQLPAAF